jgi:GntR family histidine utilization transcriptional repressor
VSAIIDSFDDISRAAPEPIYLQIKNTIQHKIDSGEWVAGQKLPSENDLVVALDVSRMTINRALRELTQQGMINRVHGIGSFVASRPRHASLIELEDIALEIEQHGKRHSSAVLNLQRLEASVEIASKMEIDLASPLYYLHAVHYQDELPIQLEARYVNAEVVPEFIDQDFTLTTSTSYLLQQLVPDEMEHIVHAVMPDRQTCKLLKIESNHPCLQLGRRTWKQGRVVTHVTLTYPGNRYDLSARYATNDYQLR